MDIMDEVELELRRLADDLAELRANLAKTLSQLPPRPPGGGEPIPEKAAA